MTAKAALETPEWLKIPGEPSLPLVCPTKYSQGRERSWGSFPGSTLELCLFLLHPPASSAAAPCPVFCPFQNGSRTGAEGLGGAGGRYGCGCCSSQFSGGRHHWQKRGEGYWHLLGFCVREDYSLLSFRISPQQLPRAPGLPTGYPTMIFPDVCISQHPPAPSPQLSVLKSLFPSLPELLIQLSLNKSKTGKTKTTNQPSPGHSGKRECSGTRSLL